MARETLDNYSQKARQAIAQGKYDQARQYYQQALGLNSKNPDIHYGLATVCFLLNDLASSAIHFREVTRLDPLRPGAFINLGAVYNRLEQFDEAITLLRKGIQLDINRAEGYYNLGLVYRKQGHLDLAIQAYREAVRVNPRMADAHYNIANIYLEKGQFAWAAAHYRQALEIRPGWEKPRRSLEQAELAIEDVSANILPPPPQEKPKEEPKGPDLDRTVDPHQHGNILQTLHRNTIDVYTEGVHFLDTLEKEVEPALKELTKLLLTPSTLPSTIEICLVKFEKALADYGTIQEKLHNKVEKVKLSSGQLLKA